MSCGACKGSKCCDFQGSCACKGSTCFNSQELGFSACRGSKCSYFVRVCACRNSISRDFVLSRAVRTKGLQMLLEVLHFPGILCAQGSTCFNQNAIIAKDSNVQISKILRASLERLSVFTGLFQKQPFWANLIQTWATPLVNKTRIFLQSIFRERTNIEYPLTQNYYLRKIILK